MSKVKMSTFAWKTFEEGHKFLRWFWQVLASLNPHNMYSDISLMKTSRDAKDGEGEDAAVALLAAAVEELAPRVEVVSPVDELVRDVGAEIHRVTRLGRPDHARRWISSLSLSLSISVIEPRTVGF